MSTDQKLAALADVLLAMITKGDRMSCSELMQMRRKLGEIKKSSRGG